MKRVSFFKTNRSDNILHIETEGCIVNISVNLHNTNFQEVTSVEIIPYNGWQYLPGGTNHRVVKERHD